MHDQILLSDRCEAVAVVVADAFRKTRIVGYEFQIRPIKIHDLLEIVERQDTVDQKYLVVRHCKGALHEAAQLRRCRRLDFESDHRTAPPALKHGLKQPHQIFRFFLDFNIRIADHAECALALHRVTREQAADEQPRRLLKRNEAGLAGIGFGRQADEPVDLVRHADQRIHRLAVAGPRQMQRDGESEIGNERERMRRIDRKGREHRIDVAQKVILNPSFLLLGDLCPVDEQQPLRGEGLVQLPPLLLLVACKLSTGLADTRELFARGQSVRASRCNSGAHLAL